MKGTYYYKKQRDDYTAQTGQKEKKTECRMSRLEVWQPSQRLPTYPRPHTSLAATRCQGARATALRRRPQNSLLCVCVCVSDI